MAGPQYLLGLEQLSWDMVVPLSAAAVASIAAFVLSRWFYAAPSPASLSAPREKETPPYDPFVQGSPTEQREAFRRGGNAILVHLMDPQHKDRTQQAWVLDRSVGGLCLAVNEPVVEGSLRNLRAANAPPATPWVEIQVRSCRQTNNDWELGCQFLKTPPWSVMLLFG
jgi:hypothetical protein